MERYCGESCREAARAWSLWKARRRYRKTQNGKENRREQNRRRRRRRQERQEERSSVSDGLARVITRDCGDFFCVGVIGPAAMSGFAAPGGRRCSDSALEAAVEQWRE